MAENIAINSNIAENIAINSNIAMMRMSTISITIEY